MVPWKLQITLWHLISQSVKANHEQFPVGNPVWVGFVLFFFFSYANFHPDNWIDLMHYGTVKLLVKTEEKQEWPMTLMG